MTHCPSILDEGYSGQPNEEYVLRTLPPAERRRIKKERRDRRDKWQKAHAARASWDDADFIAEEERLALEVQAMLEARAEGAPSTEDVDRHAA